MTKGLRNVAKLMTGTAIGQAIALLAAPVLSRLYSPDEFGVVGVFLALASVLAVVSALRLELAIVVPKADDEALVIMATALLIVGGFVLVAAVILFFMAAPIAGWLGAPAVAPLLGALPLYVGLMGTFQVFNYWSTRNSRFGRLATAHVARSVSTAATQAALGAGGLGAAGMLAGQVAGQALATATLLGRAALGGSQVLRTKVSLAVARGIVRRYSDFVAFGAPQALINAVSQSVPALVLTSAFGAGAAGQFLLAQRVVTAPGNLLGQSLRQVLYPHLSRRLDDPKLPRFALNVTLGLAGLAVVPVVLLAIFGPSVFAWLFGEEWRLGGSFAGYLSLMFAMGLTNIPAMSLIPLLRMQRWHASYEVVYLVVRVAALVVGGLLVGPIGAVAGYSFAGLAFNIVLIVVVLNRLRTWQLSNNV